MKTQAKTQTKALKGQKPQVISFNCVLRDPLGKVISSSFNHDVLARGPDSRGASSTSDEAPPASPLGQQPSHFDFHEPLEGLVEGLRSMKQGERRMIFVNAERAYGFYDPNLVMQVARKKLPLGENLEIGFQVVAQAQDGESRVFRVIDADAATVTLDGNHPLAGQDLCFDVETTSMREATKEELERKKPKPSVSQLH